MGTSSKTGQEKQLVGNFSTSFEENLYKDLYEKLKRDFEEKFEQEKEKSDRAVDQKKLERLIEEYKLIKRRYVQQYHFNSASLSNSFGQFPTSKLFSHSWCFRRRDAFNTPFGGDLF